MFGFVDGCDEKDLNSEFENMKTENCIGKQIVDASIKIHREMGPGLLESVYEYCLFHRLKQKGFKVERQKLAPVVFEGERLETGYVIDLLVQDLVVIEVKSVESLNEVHLAQTLTYLRLSNLNLGYLLNFNVALMKHGIRRVIDDWY